MVGGSVALSPEGETAKVPISLERGATSKGGERFFWERRRRRGLYLSLGNHHKVKSLLLLPIGCGECFSQITVEAVLQKAMLKRRKGGPPNQRMSLESGDSRIRKGNDPGRRILSSTKKKDRLASPGNG